MEKIDAEAGRQGKHGARRPARQSGHRREDPPLHLDRPEAQQVRSGHRPGARDLRPLAALETPDRMTGVQAHIGSQITGDRAARRDRARARRARPRPARRRGFPLETLDIGGGIGVPAPGEKAALSGGLRRRRPVRALAGLPFKVLIEPGRAIVGPRRRPPDARSLRQGERGQAIRGDRRRHERPDPPAALRRDPSDRSPSARRRTAHHGGRRGAGLRVERLLRARHRPGRAGRGRPARRPRRGSLRLRDGVQLQLPPSRGRGAGRERAVSGSIRRREIWEDAASSGWSASRGTAGRSSSGSRPRRRDARRRLRGRPRSRSRVRPTAPRPAHRSCW